IYCGPKMQGINEHWNLGAECGTGSFTNINQDAKEFDIPTPYDTSLITLNSKLNSTYVYYGSGGMTGYGTQARMDMENAKLSQTSQAKRVAVKGNAKLYDNRSWDLVDGVKDK